MKPITILNSTLLTVRFRVAYFMKGKSPTSLDSSEIEITKATVVNIPDNAYSIAIRVLGKNSSGVWKELATETLVQAETACYEVFGLESNIGFQKIECSKLNSISYIRIINKSDETIKGRLIYTVSKKGYIDESLELNKDKSRYFDIPVYAENIQFTVFAMDPTQGFKWRTLMSGNIKTPYKKCYEVIGKFPNIIFNEIKCPNLVGIVGSVGSGEIIAIPPSLEVPEINSPNKYSLPSLDEAINNPIVYDKCNPCKCKRRCNCCKKG